MLSVCAVSAATAAAADATAAAAAATTAAYLLLLHVFTFAFLSSLNVTANENMMCRFENSVMSNSILHSNNLIY